MKGIVNTSALTAALVLATVTLFAIQAAAVLCVVSDNGSGTVTLPADCSYNTQNEEPMILTDGLPPGTTIEMDATLTNFTCTHSGGLCSLPLAPGQCEGPGGALGGHGHCFEADLQLSVEGTGILTGFTRNLSVPVELEVHTGPRNPGDPVQLFPADIFRLQGQMFGDPDFCSFEIIGGTEVGLPSPGQMTLTELPSGDFAVESFFDVTYGIQFEGCPGSILEGFAGATIATVRWQQGEEYESGTWQPGDDHKMHFPQLPDTTGWDVYATFPVVLGDDWKCSETGWVKDIHFWGSWFHGNADSIGSFLISIREDIPAGVDLPYSHPGDILWEEEIEDFSAIGFSPGVWEGWYDPSMEVHTFNDHKQFFQYDINLDSPEWFWQEAGTIYWLNISANVVSAVSAMWGWKSSINHWMDNAAWSVTGDPCVVADNGTGTVTLPADCPYNTLDEEPMLILDGLPPGTSMEMDATLTNFTCDHGGGSCSLPLAPGQCETPGGLLGGHGHCFEANLQLSVEGTGALAGFTRNLSVPVELEVHTGPRNPGDPVQSFPSELFRLQGEIFGDPDFCSFRLAGGTDFGLPSPGQMTLTELPSGDFAVESFFDVTYQVQFEGCPGSILEGFVGTTTATVRWQQGESGLDIWQEMYEPSGFVLPLDLAFVITGGNADCCVGLTGNIDNDPGEIIDLGDLTKLIDYLFISFTPPVCMEEANVDGDPSGIVDLGDLTALIDYLFISFTPPAACL